MIEARPGLHRPSHSNIFISFWRQTCQGHAAAKVNAFSSYYSTNPYYQATACNTDLQFSSFLWGFGKALFHIHIEKSVHVYTSMQDTVGLRFLHVKTCISSFIWATLLCLPVQHSQQQHSLMEQPESAHTGGSAEVSNLHLVTTS